VSIDIAVIGGRLPLIYVFSGQPVCANRRSKDQ
jgi:hypothetical protein